MTTPVHTTVGLAHLTCLDTAPPELARQAARAGFGFIGLRLYAAVPGGIVYSLPPGSIAMREMKSVLAGEGIAVHDVETVVLDGAFNPATLLPVLESAAELGAKRLSVCADDEDRALSVARFAGVCGMALEFAIGVDLEFMAWRGINSLAKCRQIVEASGCANASILIDALHLSRCGNTPADVLPLPAGLVICAQLCDAPADPPQGHDAMLAEARSGRLVPGEGGLPLMALLAALPRGTIMSAEAPMASALPLEIRLKRIFEASSALIARFPPGSSRAKHKPLSGVSS